MRAQSTRPPARRRRASVPLLTWVILALLLVGLLPLGISALQIHFSREALVDESQALHLTTARSIAAEVATTLDLLTSLGTLATRHPSLHGDDGSQAAPELLAGLLQALPAVLAAGLYRIEGEAPELVLLARQKDYREAVESRMRIDDPRRVLFERREGVPTVRLRMPFDDGRLALYLLAEAANVDVALRAVELGDLADVVLADRDGGVLAGDVDTLDGFSGDLLEKVRAGRLRSGSTEYASADGERRVGAWADVDGSPWFVMTQQPAGKAKAATRAIWRTSQITFAATLVLTALLSLAAHHSIIRPLRRLAAAQRRLAGRTAGASAGGGEIAQLQESFALLERNLHDREALSRVFLGRYQVVEVLGAGAMGTVFRGWDPRLQRPVALKTIKVDPEDLGPDKRRELADPDKRRELAERLVKEAVTLARLQHPNIVTVFDVVHEGGHAFLAMELVEGESLESLLWREYRLRPNQAVPLAIALLEALGAAHREGFVHHDVKPGNVLLGRQGAIKVTDFGVSELLSNIHKDRDSVCGTPGYLAPETLLRRGYTAQSDLFAAGVVIYECLTGQRPFRGENLQETLLATAVAEPTPPSRLVPEIPDELDALILSLLQKSPEKRPPGARAALQVLERLAHDHEWTWKPGIVKTADDDEKIDDDRAHTLLIPTLDGLP